MAALGGKFVFLFQDPQGVSESLFFNMNRTGWCEELTHLLPFPCVQMMAAARWDRTKTLKSEPGYENALSEGFLILLCQQAPLAF